MEPQPASTPPNFSSNSLLSRLAWTVLILATLFVCYFSHLGAIGFVGPDEPRYAWIARDMAETGDWVTPRLYGKPWFEKPPLFYWGTALSFKLFGVSEAAARLPSAISALLATLALAWLAWRVYGGDTARWLLLLLPTTVGMIGFSHAAATDMPFSATLTIAMVCAAVVLGLLPRKSEPANVVSGAETEAQPQHASESRDTPWLALLLFGFFLGLAVLAKGPAGIVLCGGAVLFWALFTKRWRDAFRLLHPAAILAFCATALPWYILCAGRNPNFFRIFIIEHNFKRYLTPEFQHIQPFWFYAPVTLAALLPWSLLFLWDSVSGLREFWQTRRAKALTWFLICWPGFAFIFFTVSKSKLPGYVLPALPPLGLLAAREITKRIEACKGVRVLSIAGFTILAAGIVAIRYGGRIPFVTDAWPPPSVGWFEIFALVAGSSAVAFALFRRPVFSVLAVALAVFALMALDAGDLWALDAGVSARPEVRGALEHLTSEQAAAATTFKLRRAYKYQVDFYLHRETEEWSPNDKQHSIIFTSYSNQKELEGLGARCAVHIAFPAVTLCEDSNGPPILRLPGDSERGQGHGGEAK